VVIVGVEVDVLVTVGELGTGVSVTAMMTVTGAVGEGVVVFLHPISTVINNMARQTVQAYFMDVSSGF